MDLEVIEKKYIWTWKLKQTLKCVFKDETRGGIPSKARFIGWKNSYKCMGELRHNICVFAIEDLPELVTRTEFFLNKFLLEYDPIAYQCMEEWIENRVMSYQTLNIINYCRLLFVIPYSINPSCARLIENKNYPIKPLNWCKCLYNFVIVIVECLTFII